MRDALSILDKIVSFTGGKLNYSNTLEHLNILDEDYYFRMLGFMQEQKLADAMLLFDEINQKGFEGDTLLEGFAEFIRNLLVSKDAKAAVLLEVAEDFKKKYVQSAQQIHTAWLIAALNILNESIINYKQSRNKRLHVEMVLIKLSYLQQAVQLSSSDDSLDKKKLTDSAKSVAFKTIQPIRWKESPAENRKTVPVSKAGLIIESGAQAASNNNAQTVTHTRETQTAKAQPAHPQQHVAVEKPAPGFGSLAKIREQMAIQNNKGNQAKPITAASLQAAWELFIQLLENNKNHSAATNFKTSKLEVLDANSFGIITESKIQQKFIESERSALIDFMQKHFNNRILKYQVTLVETEAPETREEKPLNRKQQYQLLVEQYPQIDELRRKLRLELD